MGLLHDFRFALRLIVKERGVTAVAVGALALGIGLNATVFTLVNAVLIRGLPFRNSAQLYVLGLRAPTQAWPRSISYPDLQEWRAQTRTFDGIAAFTDGSMNLADDRALPEQARGSRLTANAFQVLGQSPLHGRDFSRRPMSNPAPSAWSSWGTASSRTATAPIQPYSAASFGSTARRPPSSAS